ncbi:MAG: hypothetical protein ACRDPY_42385 [Streptosporangiaceae bacterium]
MNLTLAQLAQITELSDQWSFLWDKRRSLWIAAEDCPDGHQFEEPDLDNLLSMVHQCPDPRSAPVWSTRVVGS